jgi:site-specific DNA-methyltransferase (adenine-specific)
MSPRPRAPRLPRNTVLIGDVRERLSELPAGSVDCVVTSPPYFQLRDYGENPDQLGLEETVQDYVAGLRTVCRQLAQVTQANRRAVAEPG